MNRITARAALPLAVLCLLALPAVAGASDASLEHALNAYKTRLTTDISYLANFSAPGSRGAAGALSKLTRIRVDLIGARNTLAGQQASTRPVAQGRTQVLTALGDSLSATAHARSSASAARSGRRATARREAQAEQRAIQTAIPLFQSGGRALHLF